MPTFTFTKTYVTIEDPTNNFIWLPGHTYSIEVTTVMQCDGDLSYDAEMVLAGLSGNNAQVLYTNNNEDATGGTEYVMDRTSFVLLDSNAPDAGYPSGSYVTPDGESKSYLTPGVWWYKWSVDIVIPASLAVGTYYFKIAEYDWDLHDYVAGWQFQAVTITGGPLPGAGVGEVHQHDATPTDWPSGGPGSLPRPGTYDEDYIYNDNAWVDIDTVLPSAGGGRWNQQLVAVGRNVIYFEEAT